MQLLPYLYYLLPISLFVIFAIISFAVVDIAISTGRDGKHRRWYAWLINMSMLVLALFIGEFI